MSFSAPEPLHCSLFVSRHLRQQEQPADNARRQTWGIHINKELTPHQQPRSAGNFAGKRNETKIGLREGQRTMDN